MIVTERDNVVNGLHIYPHAPTGLGPYITAPSARQLSLLEEAINACTYDWDRLQAIGLGVASLQFYWVNPDYLYAGHIGTVSLPTGDPIRLPTGNHMPPAFAPLTRPHDGLGDYGGFLANDAGGPSVYLLNTLDQDQPPYGGLRFYMETVVRVLGLAASYWCLGGNASQRDRLARCFYPVDRPDFALPVATKGEGGKGRTLMVHPDTPGALEAYDYRKPQPGPAVPGKTGPPGGDPQYLPDVIVYPVTGHYIYATTEVDQRMYGTSAWFFESSGVEWRMDHLGPPINVSDRPSGGPPPGPFSDTWGYRPSPVPAPAPWETRLLEAAAEAFKDAFTDKQHRRVSSRTAVKLKGGRVAWDQFVSLYMDEVPGPPDASGLGVQGARAGGGYDYAEIPRPPLDPIFVLAGAHLTEALAFFDVPKALGDDHTQVTVEIIPGHSGQYGRHFTWHVTVGWVGPRPPAYDVVGPPLNGVSYAAGSYLGSQLPLRLVIPRTDFTDTVLTIAVRGNVTGIPSAGFGIDPAAAADAMQQNMQDTLYGTNAGQSGLNQVPVYQWFKYRVLLPTKPHPRYPAGELRVDGADAGVRRNARQGIGNNGSTPEAQLPPVRPPKTSPHGPSVWRPTNGDHAVVKT